MPDPNESELIDFQGWTLRVRPATGDSARLLLLIHGLKGDENSMWVFASGLPENLWVIAPRAPHTVADGGYTWRLRQPDQVSRPEFEALRPAAEELLRTLEAYAASVSLNVETFDVMGFSQGAAVATTLMLLHPARVRRAGILSGFLPSGIDGFAGNDLLREKPIFLAHGARDETIPVDEARAARQWFERAGASVTYCEDAVGHKLSAGCLRELKDFFRQ